MDCIVQNPVVVLSQLKTLKNFDIIVYKIVLNPRSHIESYFTFAPDAGQPRDKNKKLQGDCHGDLIKESMLQVGIDHS